MSSVYDQQIKKLVDHIQALNQALHERNMQIVQWQQVARAVQDERARVARALLDTVRQALASFAGTFVGLRSENKKLRTYVDHQRQLSEVVARDLQGQLQYALSRIDDLASERGGWRDEVSSSRQGALKFQQQVQEQKGVIASQQHAVAELKNQLETASRFAGMEEQYKAERAHLEHELSTLKGQIGSADSTVASKDRELRQLQDVFETFKLRANEEVQALSLELRQNRDSQTSVDERIDDMTGLLGNSEREVARMFKEINEERHVKKELEIRLESATKEVTSLKRKLSKLEKERDTAKGEKIGDLQKKFEDMQKSYGQLKKELDDANRDKTHYMQALEGQGTKGKLRPLPPAADQNQ